MSNTSMMDTNIVHIGSCLLFLRNASHSPDVTSRLTYSDAHFFDHLGAVRSNISPDIFNVSTIKKDSSIPLLGKDTSALFFMWWIEIPHGRMPGCRGAWFTIRKLTSRGMEKAGSQRLFHLYFLPRITTLTVKVSVRCIYIDKLTFY